MPVWFSEGGILFISNKYSFLSFQLTGWQCPDIRLPIISKNGSHRSLFPNSNHHLRVWTILRIIKRRISTYLIFNVGGLDSPECSFLAQEVTYILTVIATWTQNRFLSDNAQMPASTGPNNLLPNLFSHIFPLKGYYFNQWVYRTSTSIPEKLV